MFEFNHNLAVVSPTSAKDNYLDINNNNNNGWFCRGLAVTDSIK